MDRFKPWARGEFISKQHAECDKTVESIFTIGRDLQEAKEQLEQSEWWKLTGEKEGCESLLPFGARTARMYMAINNDKDRLTDRKHTSGLPNSWYTLYELTTLNDEEFKECIESGLINSDMQRKDIAGYKSEHVLITLN